LRSIAAPTVVVAGADDRACPRRFMAAVMAEIPGATMEVIPGAGHTVQFERPAAVTAVIGSLLERLDG
jgi:pimeloyl-ACP methyl ester carboxylesterase